MEIFEVLFTSIMMVVFLFQNKIISYRFHKLPICPAIISTADKIFTFWSKMILILLKSTYNFLQSEPFYFRNNSRYVSYYIRTSGYDIKHFSQLESNISSVKFEGTLMCVQNINKIDLQSF
jgi:hypothetical protein